MKRVALIVAAVAVMVAVAIAAALLASRARLDGAVDVPGLEGQVTVERDAIGVVTVRGTSRQDLARATGFVHAQDRFFQMDLLRRRAAGELAELFGPAALFLDRRYRKHRLRRAARQVVAQLPESHRALLEAYTGGVNAGLEQLTVRPPEYLLLRTRPASWRPEDTVLVIHAMYYELTDADGMLEERRAFLERCLPEAVARFLTAGDPEFAAPLDGGSMETVPLPDASVLDLRRLEGFDLGPARSFRESLDADPDLPGGNSNGWAVAGSRSAGGHAMVANDMHLPLRVPNTWYRMHLEVDSAASPLSVTGVTLPGTPVVVAGSNGAVAWGFANSYGRWTDRVALSLDPADPLRYAAPEGYRRMDVHSEVLNVRGAAPVELSVQQTVWGPVVDDRGGFPVAVRWLAAAPESTNMNLIGLETAASVDAVLDIAATSGIPPQNIIVADARGRIGWTIAGRIPVRTPGGAGLGWLPVREYPRIVDPPSGRLWTANQQAVTGTAEELIGDGGYWHGARAAQIRDRLLAIDQASVADMLVLQLDDRALLLERWHSLLLDSLTPAVLAAHPRAEIFRNTVADWSGRAETTSVAYRLVHAFRARVRDVVFAAVTAPCRRLDPDYQFEGFRSYEGPLWRLVAGEPVHLLDPAYGSWKALRESTALEAIAYFDSISDGRFDLLTWGERNTVRIAHPLSLVVPWLSRWLDMPAVALPGDRHLPRVQGPSEGASERFAVSPGREHEGYLHMPGGQSGHPLSPFYRAGHDAWVNGEPTPFLPGPARHILALNPSG